MKTVNLEKGKIDLAEAIDLARQEPLLVVTSTGQEFLLAEADDFDREAELLGNSVDFQRFLDKRSRTEHRIPLEEVEAEVDGELARGKPNRLVLPDQLGTSQKTSGSHSVGRTRRSTMARHRSAITGRYVTAKHGKANPRTTVREGGDGKKKGGKKKKK